MKKRIEELKPSCSIAQPLQMLRVFVPSRGVPDITSVVVFDTSFHTSMPEKAYRYLYQQKYYTENKVRKYGLRTSHQYVAQEAAKGFWVVHLKS